MQLSKKKKFPKIKQVYVFFIFILVAIFSMQTVIGQDTKKGNLADEIKNSIVNKIVNKWYPLSVDTLFDGYLCDFDYKWQIKGKQDKFIVNQSRHIWVASNLSKFLGESKYKEIATHGFVFLKNKMWDKEYSGFYNLLNRNGSLMDSIYADEKRTYGNSFALYALSSYYNITKDTTALSLAKQTFYWINKNSYDEEYGGYFNALSREGMLLKVSDAPDAEVIGLKDQNTTIHLLESFTELYKVWSDSLLRVRIIDLLELIQDKMVTPKGYLKQFFKRDLSAISLIDSSEDYRKEHFYLDHVSFGHDVETAYLMLETSAVLKIPNDIKTIKIARRMVDHALKNGFDNEKGGLYDEAFYYDSDREKPIIITNSKNWWGQAEALNAFLLMSKLFPNEPKYELVFQKQWKYIKDYIIDEKYVGWYEFGKDTRPEIIKAPKGHNWKCTYHNTRALINSVNMLNDKSEILKHFLSN